MNKLSKRGKDPIAFQIHFATGSWDGNREWNCMERADCHQRGAEVPVDQVGPSMCPTLDLDDLESEW